MTGSVVHLFTYNGERVNQYVPSLPFDEIMGAYAIRPYPDRQKIVTILIRSAHNDQKIDPILIRLPHSNLKNATISIHRQKMIPKPIEASYPRAIRKINPDAYPFLFV